MKPTFKLTWLKWCPLLILAISFFSLYSTATMAQSNSLRVENLVVEVWPEYDRPEVLIIYRAELSADTPLPIEVRVPLPEYVKSLHVVAAEQNGALFEIHPGDYDLHSEGGEAWLTFTSSSRRVQFEYYDSTILTKQGSSRQLNFEFTAPYEITTTTFEVLEPFQAENFSVTPPPGNTFTGNNGLKYNQIEVSDLAPGDTFELSASYERTTDAPSLDLVQENNVSEHATDIPVDSAGEAPAIASASNNTNLTIGYVSIGAGVALLLGAGYWWWVDRTKKDNRERRRPQKKDRSRGHRQDRSAAPAHRVRPSKQVRSPTGGQVSQPSSKAQPASRFCYKCGTELRSDATFCHNCGAQRRQG